MASATPDLRTVTFPAAGHHHPFTGTKFCCFVTEAHVCEQLAQGCYLKAERPGRCPGFIGAKYPAQVSRGVT